MVYERPRSGDLGRLRVILQRHVHDQVRRRAYLLAVEVHRMDTSDPEQVTAFRERAYNVVRLLETLEYMSDTENTLTGNEIPDDLLPPLDHH